MQIRLPFLEVLHTERKLKKMTDELVHLRKSTSLYRHCATSRRSRDRFPVVSMGIFSVATDKPMCPGVDSASKNEYQGFLLE
jgi:hypothetical protein